MSDYLEYNSKERFSLWALAVVGFFSLNITFGYALFFAPDTIIAAIKNPVAVSFIVEAFLLMGAFAYLLSKWRVSKLHWGWFIILSLLGSMAFALPVVLLWPERRRN